MLELQEPLDHRASPELAAVTPARQGHKGLTDWKARRAQPEQPESATPETREPQATRDLLARQASTGSMEPKASLAPPGRRARRAQPGHKELQGRQALRGIPATQARLVIQERLAPLARKDWTAWTEGLGRQALPARQASRAPQAQPVSREPQARRVPRVPLALPGTRETPDRLGRRAPRALTG